MHYLHQTVKFSGLTICHTAKSVELEIILDIGSMIDVIKDNYLLKDIIKCTHNIIVETKVINKRLIEVGDLPVREKAFYDETYMINLRSLYQTAKK